MLSLFIHTKLTASMQADSTVSLSMYQTQPTRKMESCVITMPTTRYQPLLQEYPLSVISKAAMLYFTTQEQGTCHRKLVILIKRR